MSTPSGESSNAIRPKIAATCSPVFAFPSQLAEITTPALVVIGTSDAPGLVELSAHLAESLPDAKLVELADTGHLPSMERPDEVTALLREFLGGQPLR